MAKQFMQIGVDLSVRNFAQAQSQFSRAESMVKALGDTTGTIATESQRMTRALGAAGIALGIVGAAALGAVIPMDQLADTLERTTFMGNRVAASMGITTDAMAIEREELNKLDVARGISYGVMNSMILQGVDYARASDLVTTAMDLAAFSGIKVTQVINDLTTAVDNASTRTLRQYRITASAEVVFASYARAHGLVATALTEVEKRQAVLNYILTVGTRVAGDYNASLRTSDGITMRLGLRLQRLGEIIGASVSPIIDSVIKALTKLVETFIALPPAIQDTIGKMLLLVGVIGVVSMAFTFMLPALKVVITAFGALPALISNTTVAMAAATTAGAKWGVFIAGMGTQLARLKALLIAVGPWIIAIGSVVLGVAAIVSMYTTSAKATDAFNAALDRSDKLTKTFTKDLGAAADAAETDLKRALEGVTDALFELDNQLHALDAALWPFEDALTRIKAQSDLIIIPLERQQRVLERQLDAVNKMADALDRALQPYEDALTRVEAKANLITIPLLRQQRILQQLVDTITRQLSELDKALWPFEDELTRVRAAADLITIPLQRQERILQRQVDAIRRVEEAEQRRAEAAIKALQDQADLMQLIIDADRERLEVIDHEIFMEKIRNQILGRVASAKLITMKSSSRVLTDQVDQEELALKKTQDLVTAEQKRWDERQAALEAQQQVIQDQIDQLREMIQLELDKVTYAQEELTLRQAIQVEARLALLEQQRLLQYQIDQLQVIIQLEADKVTYAQEELALQQAMQVEARLAVLAQQQLLQDQIDRLKETIQLQKDKITYVEEELALRQAAQVEERLAILAQRRYWEEEQRQLKHALELVERVKAAAAETAAIAAEITPALELPEPPISEAGTIKLPWYAETLAQIVSWTKFAIYDIKQLFQGKGLIKDWLVQASQDIIDWVVTSSQDIRNWGYKVHVLISDATWKVIDAIKNWTTQAGTDIKNWVTQAGIDIKNWGIQAGIDIKNWTVQAGKDIASWATTAAADISNFCSVVLTTLTTWISETATTVWNDAKSIGSSIINGIRKGIEDAWTAITIGVGKLPGLLIDKIKKAIGWGSPARKFVPIGASIADGIALGFQNRLLAWTRKMGPQMQMVVSGFDRQVNATIPVGGSNVYNYYGNTDSGPRINVEAQYSRPQSTATIRDDIGLLMAVTRP